MDSKDKVAKRREALLTALRSGKYKQTYGVYRNAGCFCAVGVALDTYRKCMKSPKVRWVNGELYIPKRDNNNIVRAYFGMDARVWGQAIGWNDAERLPFSAIANRLEALWNPR